MTCDDVQRLLHPFVDTELPPPMLLAVARHAGGCVACDAAIRALTALREALVADVERRVEALDLEPVWGRVAEAIDRQDRRAHHAARVRRVGTWGPPLALAASVALAVGLTWGIGGRVPPGTPDAAGARTASVRQSRPAASPEPLRRVVSVDRPPASLLDQAPRVAAVAELQRNRAAFDRLRGRAIEVKREPKSGTTVVWVSYTGE